MTGSLEAPRVHNKHAGTAPDDAIYVGRGSPWGNPFRIGFDGDRDEVCDRFEKEVLPSLDVSSLRGKHLICFCAPSRCHADALLRRANSIFVFGSNEAGRHGKGAALWALQNRGAIYGVGEGLQGQSYAIPTKDRRIKTLPLDQIAINVREFLLFAVLHPDLLFEVTPVGCGLAGYTPEQIGPMFAAAPDNCLLPNEFKPYLE